MLTPLFGIEDIRALRADPEADLLELQHLRDKSLLWSATDLALQSAFKYGLDLPVGAVSAAGDWINGRYFASDRRAGYRQMHAEYMAIQDASLDVMSPLSDTVVVTIEPCDNCQTFLATVPGIKRVGFGIPRHEVAASGIVKPHAETIFERAARVGLPYEVAHIEDPLLHKIGTIILENVSRDPVHETLEVDTEKLRRSLQLLQVA